jgi:serine/threonine-protein kinase RsbW
VHGNRLEAEKQVGISVDVEPGLRATIEIRDSGAGFDHNAVHDPTHPERVLVPGGRGVFLMRRLVDELQYNEAGNVVCLTVHSRRP